MKYTDKVKPTIRNILDGFNFFSETKLFVAQSKCFLLSVDILSSDSNLMPSLASTEFFIHSLYAGILKYNLLNYFHFKTDLIY